MSFPCSMSSPRYRRENVLALGTSGTGKTHLALALGLAACQKGSRVRFITGRVPNLVEKGKWRNLLLTQTDRR